MPADIWGVEFGRAYEAASPAVQYAIGMSAAIYFVSMASIIILAERYIKEGKLVGKVKNQPKNKDNSLNSY